MVGLTDEMMFYGGILMVITALVGLIFYLVISHIRISGLKKKLAQEYGEERKAGK